MRAWFIEEGYSDDLPAQREHDCATDTEGEATGIHENERELREAINGMLEGSFSHLSHNAVTQIFHHRLSAALEEEQQQLGNSIPTLQPTQPTQLSARPVPNIGVRRARPGAARR